MENRSQILYTPGRAEITEKKSRFIAETFPVSSEAEASAILERIRKDSWDATHHCYAYVIGERNELCRSSDDREPSGTAGRPILEVLLGSGIRNAMIIVTRYFGGVLLGTGGLVRAYGAAAKAGLEASGILQTCSGEEWEIRCDYTLLPRIRRLTESGMLLEDGIEYADNVRLHCFVPEEYCDKLRGELRDLSAGRAEAVTLQKLRFGIADKKILRL